MSKPSPIDSPLVYPRVYRASGGWLVFLTLCGTGFAIGGMLVAWFAATAPLRNSQSRVWLVGLGLAVGVFGAYCLLSIFRSRVVLFPDRIEVDELTRSDVLSRAELRGWRSLRTSPQTFVLVPKDPCRRSIKVVRVFHLDPPFAEWMRTLPCLDDDDARNSKIEIRRNTRLGETPGERMKALAKGTRLAKVLTAFTLLAALWGFLYPRPYELAIVALSALPWIAIEIVRRSSGLFRVDSSPNDTHPNVVVTLILPGAVLMLRAIHDFNVLPSMAVVGYSIGIGGLLCLAAISADPTRREKVFELMCLFAFTLAYGYGVSVEANVLLDRLPGTNYTASVRGKHVARGKATSYQVELEPWGPKTTANELQVSRATYDPIQRGDVVCLTLRQGALGLAWGLRGAWRDADPSVTNQSLH